MWLRYWFIGIEEGGALGCQMGASAGAGDGASTDMLGVSMVCGQCLLSLPCNLETVVLFHYFLIRRSSTNDRREDPARGDWPRDAVPRLRAPNIAGRYAANFGAPHPARVVLRDL